MKQAVTEKNSITTGSIPRGMLVYFFPILVGSLFQQLYNTVDAVIVGRYLGTNALAAVGGSAGQAAGIVIWLLGGIASGATVTVAQHFGAGDLKGVHRDIHNGVALAVIGSLLFTVFGILLAPALFRLMATPEEVMEDSLIYIRILFAGLLVTFMFNMGSGILRALGDSKRPLYYLIVCCIVNIILDIVFVAVVGMGVAGAALATVIAQLISAVLVTIRVMRLPDEYRLKIGKIRIYPAVMKAQLKIGLPGGFQSALYGIANMLIQTSINSLGTSTMAAYTAYAKVDNLFWLFDGAFGTTVTTFVGQNYGAGNLDRVKKSTFFGLEAEAVMAVVLAVFVVGLSGPLLGFFSTDAEVIALGQRFMVLISPFYFTYVCVEILSASLRGLGDVFIPTIITLSGICAFRVIWMLTVFKLNPGIDLLSVVFPISWALTSILFIIYFIISWKKLRRRFPGRV